jgi:hypothetical protein
MVRLTLLGVGAMNSPRYAPAGLLVEHRRHRVMLDGGPGAEPRGKIDAWLVTDEQGELMRICSRDWPAERMATVSAGPVRRPQEAYPESEGRGHKRELLQATPHWKAADQH